MAARLRRRGLFPAMIGVAGLLALSGGAVAGSWRSPAAGAAGPTTPADAATAQGAPAAPVADGVSGGSAGYYGSATGSPAERAVQAQRDADRRRVEEAQDRFYADEQARAKARSQGFDSKSTDYYRRP